MPRELTSEEREKDGQVLGALDCVVDFGMPAAAQNAASEVNLSDRR